MKKFKNLKNAFLINKKHGFVFFKTLSFSNQTRYSKSDNGNRSKSPLLHLKMYHMFEKDQKIKSGHPTLNKGKKSIFSTSSISRTRPDIQNRTTDLDSGDRFTYKKCLIFSKNPKTKIFIFFVLDRLYLEN